MDTPDKHFAYNEAFRQKLDHEHSVMNNRIGWYHVIQIAMFTGFFNAVSSTSVFHYITIALPLLGLLYSFSALYSIWVSEKARAYIFMEWNRYQKKEGIKWENYPPVSSDPLPHIRNSVKDPTIIIDMGLKNHDIVFASKKIHWLKLYKINPFIFIALWIVCLYEVKNM